MSADADEFMRRLLATGFKLKLGDASPYEGDFEDLGEDDWFVAKTKSVSLLRVSEHYFSVRIRLKNGNFLFMDLPIKKIQLYAPEKENAVNEKIG